MKKTPEECKEIVANDNGYYDWNQVILFNTEIELLTDLANKMYYEQSEWISVDDELPKNNDNVLVITSSNSYYLDNTPFIEFVTHWQPLPNPPKK